MFIYLAGQKKFKSATIADKNADLCFKIDSAAKALNEIKILTEQKEPYEEYCEELILSLGACPLVCEEKSLSGISYHLKEKDACLSFGQGNLRADISSPFCPEAEKLCPKGIDKQLFFPLAFYFCAFPPLLGAVPTRLGLKDFSADINSIF